MSTAHPRERMLAGLPTATRTVDVAGVSTAVIEAGDGPPLLLLHGGIECGGAMWAPVLTQLAQRHRVVAPDVPGLGESAPLARLDVDTLRPLAHRRCRADRPRTSHRRRPLTRSAVSPPGSPPEEPS